MVSEGGYVIDVDTTPDDLGDVDEVGRYRQPDGSTAPVFTPEQLDDLGNLAEKLPGPRIRIPNKRDPASGSRPSS